MSGPDAPGPPAWQACPEWQLCEEDASVQGADGASVQGADGASVQGADGATTQGADGELEGLLRRLREIIFRHPIATQAAFAALVAEGRRFAQEPQGQALLDQLSRSPSMAQARMLWEVTSMNAFEEDPNAVLPGVFIDELVSRMRGRLLTPILARVFGRP